MSAPRLILLPGLDGTGDLFTPFSDALGADLPSTVVRYSSPPLSRYSECTEAARARLPRDEPYVLLGESFSGPITIALAAERPAGLRGVVLVGSFAVCPQQMLRWVAPFIRFMPMHGAPQLITDFALLGPFATPELRKQVESAMARVPPAVVRTRLREIAFVDVSEALRSVRLPLLYLRGTQDRLVPRSCSDRIARLAPHIRIVDVDAPHLILQCAPRACAAAVRDFALESARNPAA